MKLLHTGFIDPIHDGVLLAIDRLMLPWNLREVNLQDSDATCTKHSPGFAFEPFSLLLTSSADRDVAWTCASNLRRLVPCRGNDDPTY